MTTRSLAGLTALVSLLIISGCAHQTGIPIASADIKTVAQADKAVVMLGDTFESAMKIATLLRANGKLSDASWAKVDQAQKQVNLYGPILADAVLAWRASGDRSVFDKFFVVLRTAVFDLDATVKGVTP